MRNQNDKIYFDELKRKYQEKLNADLLDVIYDDQMLFMQ